MIFQELAEQFRMDEAREHFQAVDDTRPRTIKIRMPIDGKDLIPLLAGQSQESSHEDLYFIRSGEAVGVRTRDGFKYFEDG